MSPDLPSPLNGRYEILSKLGEGGFSSTHLARDLVSGHNCVVKILSYQHLRDAKAIELFSRESRVLANLEHARIPKFLDSFTIGEGRDQWFCLVQEYVEGKSLRQYVEAGRHFTEKEAIRLAIGVAEVLEYLHGFSPPIVHRDIKPGNLILSSAPGTERKPHLIDFGAVQDQMRLPENSLTVVGTYGYMAPEQFEGEARPQSDLYSLGITLIALLSHKEPRKIDKVDLRYNFRPHVQITSGFASVLDRLLEPDWKKRYQTATELRKDLERLLAGKGSSKSAVIWLALAAFVLLAGVLSYFLFPSRTPPVEKYQPVAREAPPEAVPTPVPTIGIVEEIEVRTVVEGRMFFDGRPITDFTNAVPSLWFRNEAKKGVESPRTEIVGNYFKITNLPEDPIGMSVTVDANMKNAMSYPGDYRAWTSFTVGEKPISVTVNLQKIIRLTSPEDNDGRLPKWGERCEGKATWPSPVRFAWDPMGEGVFYDVTIDRVKCPYTSHNSYFSKTTEQTEVTVRLPDSERGEYYILKLGARKDGRPYGMLMTHGANGYGWDYRFRVGSQK